MFFNFFIFIISFLLLFFSSKWIINSLLRIAKFLAWKEFIVGFLFFAFFASLPNFFVGIVSAFNRVPELSLGDVIGGNIIDLTIIIGIATLISKAGISAPSRIVQGSTFYLILLTLLFSFLIGDGNLSRGDGIILSLLFCFYLSWLFRKKERFKKIYEEVEEIKGFSFFFKNLGIFLISIFLILLASQGIVSSAQSLANDLNFPLWFIGLIVVAWGNALPELFFSLQCAKKSEDWLILGDLIGSVIISLTLVLGIVALISPIKIENLQALLVSRVFLLISAFLFFVLLRTGKKLSALEGKFLIFLYFLYLGFEIILK